MGVGGLHFSKQVSGFCCRRAGGLTWRNIDGNFAARHIRDQFLASQLTACVTLNKLVYLHKPQSPHLF